MPNTTIDTILRAVRAARKLDFSRYRKNVIERRVRLRVSITGQENLKHYAKYLRSHPDEMDRLTEALTINVTEFFRDPGVFKVMEKNIIPEIFERKERNKSRTVRIWSCGSASGEEAYSVLMLMAWYLGERIDGYRIRMYGTDIDKEAIRKAREGVYESARFDRIPADRKRLIARYSLNEGDGRIRVREEIASLARFSCHNIISDPPLERMDVVLCRNMFIYFDRELQEDIIGRFHKSLNRGGFLVMGQTECIWTASRDGYGEYDSKARIYIKK